MNELHKTTLYQVDKLFETSGWLPITHPASEKYTRKNYRRFRDEYPDKDFRLIKIETITIKTIVKDEIATLPDVIKHYLMGRLPENITVRMVKYKRIAGEIVLISDTPELQRSKSRPLPPNCNRERITLEEITIDDQVLVAGYGLLSRTLMIGQEDKEDFD